MWVVVVFWVVVVVGVVLVVPPEVEDPIVGVVPVDVWNEGVVHVGAQDTVDPDVAAVVVKTPQVACLGSTQRPE